MSNINTEIARLEGEKQNIKSFLTNNGVSVQADALIDDVVNKTSEIDNEISEQADLIAQIKAALAAKVGG